MSDLSIITQAQGLALVLAAGHRMGLPQPDRVILDNHDNVRMFLTMDGLRDWAQWADTSILQGEPHEYLSGKWAVAHTATGTIYDLPITFAATEFGVMVEADRFDCDHCGARFGSTAGFVASGTYDDFFEVEVARHQDGACVGAEVTR